ncbi:MAG: hypothetical protein KKE42_10575 [Alphaproteobacteria bacterium]|uniref:STM3941 family protein n=1 Tax=Brevundimonas sp. TaxID=1871086 RepID=UPI001D7AADDC|nr:STM3941 family protein [Brevundimonas sp.]MBU3974227.1 hypothetical protein [Alphaproteobacteria bacterium]MBU4038293.1 hypothetical protein [Alphaproteobacteria bacterium]MBU4135948.1 hypothetical protein [Alphaproteobacteria bacterium]
MVETLILRQDASKTKWVLPGSVAFVAFGIWMVINPESSRYSPEFVRFAGLASIAFFGWVGINSFRSRSRPVELILTPEGFEVGGPRPKPIVPWKNIERFFIVTVRGIELVSYDMKPGVGVVRRGLATLNTSLTGADGQVPAYLDRAPEEVCELLEGWRRRHAESG